MLADGVGEPAIMPLPKLPLKNNKPNNTTKVTARSITIVFNLFV